MITHTTKNYDTSLSYYTYVYVELKIITQTKYKCIHPKKPINIKTLNHIPTYNKYANVKHIRVIGNLE